MKCVNLVRGLIVSRLHPRALRDPPRAPLPVPGLRQGSNSSTNSTNSTNSTSSTNSNHSNHSNHISNSNKDDDNGLRQGRRRAPRRRGIIISIIYHCCY